MDRIIVAPITRRLSKLIRQATRRQHRAIVEATRRAALLHGNTPATAQAIIWVVVRDREAHNRFADALGA